MHFFGPHEERRHDTTVFAASGLLRYFDQHSDIFDGRCIFGDPAYSISKYVVTGYEHVLLTTHQHVFNKEMSSVRTAVEWNFKLMKSLWAYVDFKKGLKIRLSPVGKFVRVSMLLTNCHMLQRRQPN